MFPPSRASRARNGTMTASHSDPFALCAVISWIASACAGSVSRILSKLRRSVSAKSASDSCRASAAAAAPSSFSSSFTESPNSSRGRVRNRSRSCVIRTISRTALKSGWWGRLSRTRVNRFNVPATTPRPVIFRSI